MERVEVNSFKVTGFVVRTSNADEMNSTTAKIGALWESFYQNASSQLTNESKVYGLYTNYESDEKGAYDVVACSNTLSTEESANASEFQIASGKYLKFSGKGEIPQAVIELWGEVWQYFSSDSCNDVRAYTTDFEFYKSNDEIEIYIAVN